MKNQYLLSLVFFTVLLIFAGCSRTEKKAPLFPAAISNAQFTHCLCSDENSRELSKEEISSMESWAQALQLQPAAFPEGQAPNQTQAGGEAYIFSFNNGEHSFSYMVLENAYIVAGEKWYLVKNPSSPPVEIQEQPLGDRIPMVMVDGHLYCDTGKQSTLTGRCGVMDGKIATAVPRSQVPEENDQSNFGTGYGYQYRRDGNIDVYINSKWFVFEKENSQEEEVSLFFQGRPIEKSSLSAKTAEWLVWYNSLSQEEQQAVEEIPAELLEKCGLPKAAEVSPPNQP